MLRILLLFLPLLSFYASYSQIDLFFEPFVSGVNSPVDITNAGDERLFVVEQAGVIKIIDSEANLLPTPFLDIRDRISSGGERGLLGLAFHPNYSQNGYFFVNYTNNSGDTHIARFKRSDTNANQADANSELVLMTIGQPYSNHNAGDLNFGPDGYLYFGLGDGGSGGDPQNFAQNNLSYLGKMLRIDVDNGDPYAIPDDNPFVGDDDYRPEIWATGLRNPWRFSFDALRGDMWIGDVGQNAWEEINFQAADSQGGEDYGWSCLEGTTVFRQDRCDSDLDSYTEPVFEYANTSNVGCSVTGGFVYRGCKYPQLYGQYLFTDFCTGRFWAIDYCPQDTCAEVFITTQLGNFEDGQYTTMGQGADGELYLSGYATNEIFRITELTAVFEAPKIDSSNTGFSVPPGLGQYAWFRIGESEPFNTVASEVSPEVSGAYYVLITHPVTGCQVSSDTLAFEGTSDTEQIAEDDLHLSISPNPVCEQLNISMHHTQSGRWTIQISDVLGNVVYEKTSKPLAGKNRTQIPVQHLSGGWYILKMQSREGRVAATSFIKK